MNQIKAKVYYLIYTGEVLTITSEMQGCVEQTTKEQDMTMYLQLKDKNIDDIDFIELEYGTLSTTFNNVKTYSINLETKTLEVIYYTQEELDVQTLEQLSRQTISDRINTISTYINLDNTSIEDLENYILQREKDKTIGGVI